MARPIFPESSPYLEVLVPPFGSLRTLPGALRLAQVAERKSPPMDGWPACPGYPLQSGSGSGSGAIRCIVYTVVHYGQYTLYTIHSQLPNNELLGIKSEINISFQTTSICFLVKVVREKTVLCSMLLLFFKDLILLGELAP